jgi:predicted nuclease of predicted toxin-antitoxin system
MNFLIDHNLKGHALVFFGAIAAQGWLDYVPIRFVTFADMNLSTDRDDKVVWRTAQANQMILLTANRSMKGKDFLEQGAANLYSITRKNLYPQAFLSQQPLQLKL